jgi:hypothetical protein
MLMQTNSVCNPFEQFAGYKGPHRTIVTAELISKDVNNPSSQSDIAQTNSNRG